MSWIEGVGDEVTITFTILLGLFVLLLAWFSTGIREIPFISVIIVQLTRRRVRAQNVDQPPSQTETAESSPDADPRETTEPEQDTAQTTDSNTELPPSVSTVETSKLDNNIVVDNVTSSPSSSNEENENRHIEEVVTPVIATTNESENVDSNTTENTETLADTEHQHTQPTENSNTGVTALPEQELRQKRLEFFIKGSPTTEEISTSHVEDASSSESSNQTPSSSSTDQSTTPPPQSSPSSSPSDTNADASSARLENDERGESVPDAEESDEIRVRIKFFNDEQRSVTCSPTDTIGSFRRQHFSTELSESKLVRFIFNGQDLRNDASTLQSYRIVDNSVLHCLITQPPPTAQPGGDEDDGMDMGVFMFPLFGLLLAIVWYMRFMYRQFFNVTSTLTLGGITFLYLAAFLSTMRGRRHEHLD